MAEYCPKCGNTEFTVKDGAVGYEWTMMMTCTKCKHVIYR